MKELNVSQIQVVSGGFTLPPMDVMDYVCITVAQTLGLTLVKAAAAKYAPKLKLLDYPDSLYVPLAILISTVSGAYISQQIKGYFKTQE